VVDLKTHRQFIQPHKGTNNMKLKRIGLGLLVLSMLSCNFVTRMIIPRPLRRSQPRRRSQPSRQLPLRWSHRTFRQSVRPPRRSPRSRRTLRWLSPPSPLSRTPKFPKTCKWMCSTNSPKKVDAVYVYPDFNGKDWAEIKARYRAKIEAGVGYRIVLPGNAGDDQRTGRRAFVLIFRLSRWKPPKRSCAARTIMWAWGIFSLPDPERQIISIIFHLPRLARRTCGN
jgi:hypothetical protein